MKSRNKESTILAFKDVYKYLQSKNCKPSKNHLIAGICTVDPLFPIQLWDELLPQSQDTLNLLRTSRNNPKLSAYAILEGEFNFNKNPLAPPGTKALVYVDPTQRTTWGTHAVGGWYVSPAKQHYRCITREAQILQSVKTLATALLRPITTDALAPENNTALRSLVNIFNTSTDTMPTDSPPPRRSAR